MKRNDVNDQPAPMVHLPLAHESAQLLSNFAMEHCLEIARVGMTNM